MVPKSKFTPPFQVHSIKFPSPILNFGVAPDDGFIACGMTDGLVQFIHRKDLDKVQLSFDTWGQLLMSQNNRVTHLVEQNPLPVDLVPTVMAAGGPLLYSIFKSFEDNAA